MKRTLAVLFATALLVFTLAGCGTDKDANNGNGSASVGDTGNGSSDSNDQGTGGANGNGGDIITGTDEPGDGQNNTEGSTLEPGDGALNGETGAGDTGLTNNGENKDASSAAARSYRTAGGNDALFHGASYNQMVRNARVHDADGILTDGENSLTPGVAH